MKMKFFTYDHHGEGMEYHDTAQEAKKYAQEIIDICWGKVKQSVHANDENYKFKTVK